LALSREGPHGPALYAVNAAAAREGLHSGMGLADARALLPELAVEPADPSADGAALERLARWCGRWSPWVRADPPDGILIDASGCAHLFACPEQGRRSGEAAMLSDIAARLARLGLEARLAMADTPGAAHALARYTASATTLAAPGETSRPLAPLPVAALRIDPETATTLKRLGLTAIGDLLELPRSSLARRFGAGGARAGESVLHRLDQALGRVFEPVEPEAPAPAFRLRRGFLEPVTQIPALTCPLEDLLGELTALLARHGQGARRVSLTAYSCDGTASRIAAGTNRASRDPAHLRRLLGERLESLDSGFGIEELVLAADAAATLDPAQADLDGRAARQAGLYELTDRLALRLGARHVGRMAPRESHLPERGERRLPGTAEPHWREDGHPPAPPRPLTLLPRPEPVAVMAEIPEGPPLTFRWRRVAYRVARAEGPERIAPDWWRGGAETELRDYYRVEDTAGRRFWLFRAGRYDAAESAGAPRWFLHGLFA